MYVEKYFINIRLTIKKKTNIFNIIKYFNWYIRNDKFQFKYIYIKFILFDELIFKEHLLKIFPSFFELKKFDQTIYFSILIFGLFSFKNLYFNNFIKN